MIAKRLKILNQTFYPKYNFFSPSWIILGVNNICNLHCKMCDVGTGSYDTVFAQNLVGTQPINMPLELLKTIIDQMAMYFPAAKLGYAFTEPLIYPHLIESLEYAQNKGLFTSITTNALTLKQKANNLVKAGLNEIFISLDGTSEIHNGIRGNKKSFEKAVEGIEELLKYENRPKISVVYAITQWNIDCMVEFLEFFKNIPIDKAGFMHSVFINNDVANQHNHKYGELYPATTSNIESVDLSKINLKLLQKNIYEIRNTVYPFPIFFSPEMNTEEELAIYYQQPSKILGSNCSDVFNYMMIKSDGSVIPAHGRCFNLKVGNIYEDSLKSIWNSNIFNKLRTDMMHAGGYFDACSRCCSGFNGYGIKK